MNNPRPDGLSSQEEFDQLCEIGDAIDAVIDGSNGNHFYVGRNTSSGNRDVYFYTQNQKQLEESFIPREIDHRVYFSKKQVLKNYQDFLEKLNFAITETGRTKPLVGEYYIDFKRVDVPAEINETVYEIFTKSTELNGTYDGWGCTVQKSETLH